MRVSNEWPLEGDIYIYTYGKILGGILQIVFFANFNVDGLKY